MTPPHPAIVDGNRRTMVGAWVFATLWNLVSLPAGFFGVRDALQKGDHAALVALLFPLVGIGLLVWAVRATLRHRRFGISRLELATLPAAVGRELRGTVAVRGLLHGPEGIHATLTCLRRETRGSGKNRSTRETVLWQEEQRVRGEPSRTAEGMLTSIPVAFRIPADAEPADTTDPRNQVIWLLAVAASVPGVDYDAAFEVPVARAPASGEAELEPLAPEIRRPYVPSGSSRIRVTLNRRGTEVLFPAARNAGASAGLTLFLAIWLAAVWAMVHFGAPAVFQAVFGGFGVLLVWVTVAAWLGVSRVTVGDGTVTVGRGLLAPMREERMAAPEVAEVVTRIGMQVGGTPYYDLVLVRKDGRKVPAGRAIRDKREAEWLADTLREALKGDE